MSRRTALEYYSLVKPGRISFTPSCDFKVETLDDALLKLYPELLSRKPNVTASRGDNTEILGALIEVAQVRARLSRSEIGENPSARWANCSGISLATIDWISLSLTSPAIATRARMGSRFLAGMGGDCFVSAATIKSETSSRCSATDPPQGGQ